MPDPEKTVAQALHGYVYFVETDDLRLIKIGFSTKPYSRFKDLAQGCPSLRLLGCVVGSTHLERQLHERFAADREKCEWFRGSPALREFVASLKLVPFEDLNAVLELVSPDAPLRPRMKRCRPMAIRKPTIRPAISSPLLAPKAKRASGRDVAFRSELLRDRVLKLPVRFHDSAIELSEVKNFVTKKIAEYRKRADLDPAVIAARAILSAWTVRPGHTRRSKFTTLADLDAAQR